MITSIWDTTGCGKTILWYVPSLILSRVDDNGKMKAAAPFIWMQKASGVDLFPGHFEIETIRALNVLSIRSQIVS